MSRPYEQQPAIEILKEMAEGKPRKEIQKEKGLTRYELNHHLEMMRRKHGAADTFHLGVKLAKQNII